MPFIDEVSEQPFYLRKLINYYQKEGNFLLDEAKNIINSTRTRSIVFIGMGTSCIAPFIIRDLLSINSKIVPVIWDAGEFLHYSASSLKDEDVLVAISQSGESIETKKCVEKLKKHKRIISITNNSDSTISKLSTLNLPLLAGKEESISNKTYTNTITLLLLLAYKITGKSLRQILDKLLISADEMELFISERKDEIKQAGDFFKSADCIHFIGRGPSSVCAYQSALTWMEGVHITGVAFSGGSFRHGPFEVTGKGNHVISFAPESEGGKLVEKLSEEIAGLGSKVIIFSGRNTRKKKNLFVIKIRPQEERIFPVSTAVAQEMLLAKMAEDRKLVPGKFSKIGKITSIE